MVFTPGQNFRLRREGAAGSVWTHHSAPFMDLEPASEARGVSEKSSRNVSLKKKTTLGGIYYCGCQVKTLVVKTLVVKKRRQRDPQNASRVDLLKISNILGHSERL